MIHWKPKKLPIGPEVMISEDGHWELSRDAGRNLYVLSTEEACEPVIPVGVGPSVAVAGNKMIEKIDLMIAQLQRYRALAVAEWGEPPEGSK